METILTWYYAGRYRAVNGKTAIRFVDGEGNEFPFFKSRKWKNAVVIGGAYEIKAETAEDGNVSYYFRTLQYKGGALHEKANEWRTQDKALQVILDSEATEKKAAKDTEFERALEVLQNRLNACTPRMRAGFFAYIISRLR